MSDDVAFLHALRAFPEDDTRRLVYADWLDERGDLRGEYLRLEVAARAAEPGDRRDELLKRIRIVREPLDLRWLAAVDRPQPGWRIAGEGANGPVYGRAIPAFINNSSRHYAPIKVYANGAVDCWGFVDLPLFRDMLAQKWVIPTAAARSSLSIHNLGQAKVLAGEWDHTADDIERRVMDAIRELNPRGEALLDTQRSDVELRNGMGYANGGGVRRGEPYRVTPEGEVVAGRELPVFEVMPDGLRLRHWMLYADGLTQLGYGGELIPLESVRAMFDDGRLTLSVPPQTWVLLDGLGRFRAGRGSWWVEPAERLREAADLIDTLNGGPGAGHRCMETLAQYEGDPTDERKEALRAAYHTVPEHLRMYCGDMDSKDLPIRRILGPDAVAAEPE